MKFFYLVVLTALSALDAVAQNCPLFDHAFGNAGVAIGISGSLNGGKLVVQPDNKIVQVFINYNYAKFGVVRYKSSGALDSSFGSNGKVETEVGTDGSYSYSVALQSDGKLVVVGAAYNANGSDFAIVRYLGNGSLDSSFGINGKSITSVGPNYDAAYDVTIQQDGKIIVAGASNDNNYNSAYAVARYHTNGTVDSSFGQNGKAVFHLGPFITYIGNYYYGQYAGEWARVVVAQPDGKILVAGTSYALNNCYDYYGSIYCDEAFGMARLNSNGSIDSTFGNNGNVRDTLLLRTASGMALQTDGKILVTGNGTQQAFIAERYNSNGKLDSTFGTNGKVINIVGGAGFASVSNSVAVLPDEKIVLSGISFNNSSFAVIRLLTNGSPDVSFNNTGSAIFHIQPGSSDYASSLAIQDAKIIIGGSSGNGNTQSLVVVRLLDNAAVILPVITAGGPLTFCAGNNVRLVSSEQGTTQWYRNNTPIIGATDTVYMAAGSGTYFVRVSNSNGCGNSLPVIVAVNNNPVQPPVNWSTPVFSTTTGYPHYQWWLNDVIIAGSDSNSFRATQTGEYKVTVFDSLGCRSTSDSFILRVLAVGDIVIGGSKLRYYPNPVQSVLHIEVSNPSVNKLKAELYDVSGKLVYTQLLNQTHNQLTLQKLPTGFYQLVIHNKVKRVAVKLIVGR